MSHESELMQVAQEVDVARKSRPVTIPTLEQNQARLRREQAEICKGLGYSVPAREAEQGRDYIANLARTAIRAIDWAAEGPYTPYFPPSLHIADAKQAVELILAEVTK